MAKGADEARILKLLDEEVDIVRVVFLSGGRWILAAWLAMSALAALVLDMRSAIFTLVAAFVFGLFLLAVRRRKQPPPPHLVPLMGGAVMLLPGLDFLNTAMFMKPEDALTNWGTAILMVALIVGVIVRLNPWLPLAMGVVGAVEVLAIELFIILPRMPPDSPWASALERSISWHPVLLLASGLGSMMATRTLRRAVLAGAQAIEAQQLFGKYRLEKDIAEGGMGVVTLATYCPEGGFVRPVAIKRIHPHLAKNPRVVDAFRQEAELSARLLHPGVVSVFDFGRASDTYFLAMEYVDGADLRRIMRMCRTTRARPSMPLVAWIGREVLGALHFAHATARDADGRLLRVVHRDLSPTNILVSKSGAVKVTDFGIARALYDSEAHETKHVAGKVAYMAPEQAEGRAVDERADLFALGVVLWELAAGRYLFAADGSVPTLVRLLACEVPPLESLRDDVGPAWADFFARAICSDPDERFPSASDMADMLTNILEEEGAPHPDELSGLVAQTLRSDQGDGFAGEAATSAETVPEAGQATLTQRVSR